MAYAVRQDLSEHVELLRFRVLGVRVLGFRLWSLGLKLRIVEFRVRVLGLRFGV